MTMALTTTDQEAQPHSDEERLLELFRGYEDGHGTYDLKIVWLDPVKNKMETKDKDGKGTRWVDSPPTPDLFRLHLEGTRPLGISPLRKDGMCRWGVIDVDEYIGLSHLGLAAQIEKQKLPLLVCRSKSGGAHLLMFATEWMPQADMNRALVAMRDALDITKGEVFPTENSTGNYLNMPYFDAEKSDRYAIGRASPTAKISLGLTLGQFLRLAESSRIPTAEIAAIADVRKTRGKPDEKAIAASKRERAARDLDRFEDEISTAPDGTRAKLLFGRAKDMGRWIGAGFIDEGKVASRLLQAAVTCGLDYREANGHITNGIEAGKSETPPEDADGDRYPQIEKIVILTGGDETMWIVTLAGHGEMTLPVKDVMHYWTFNLRCAEHLKVSFRQMKGDAWSDRVNEALRHAETREVPRDETPEALFLNMLAEFCHNRRTGDRIEELETREAVWINDETENRIYFRFENLLNFAQKTAQFKGYKASRLGRLLAGIGRDKIDYGKTTKPLRGVTTEVRWIRGDFFKRPVGDIPLPNFAREPF